jgi:hypothetical protein
MRAVGSDRVATGCRLGWSTQGNFIRQADMRTHLIIIVVGLFVVLAGFDAALTSFAHPTLGAAAQSAAPLLFRGDWSHSNIATAIKQEVALTDIAQLEKQPYSLLASEQEHQTISAWRLRLIAFYGSLLALLIAFGATSQAPRERQADLASDDFVTHYVSNPPVP